MADEAASLPTTGDSATASVTNEPSSVAAGKRKAMKQRSKVWDHFTKFVNDAGEIKEVGDDDFQQIELDFQKIALEATVDI
ncbi:hypothetical protein QN277_018845 [Acacia crassicarpa]|uniref:Uncharacterized protein n=1 Tax=Acacia crassicarpa TaxID=499986 RepID=A0AAE1JSL3_9FABA|nr:hypothetical protein QN277_018845 [Acacia crassicarpa]